MTVTAVGSTPAAGAGINRVSATGPQVTPVDPTALGLDLVVTVNLGVSGAPRAEPSRLDVPVREAPALADLQPKRGTRDPRVSTEPLPRHRRLEPRLERLAPLVSLASREPERLGALVKVALGFALVASDAHEAEPAPRVAARAQSVASKLLASSRETTSALVALAAKRAVAQRAISEGDVQAFVQRVLRESYLLNSGLLRDQAAKTRHYNELKKQLRDRLGEARETQSRWRTMAGNTDPATFVAEEPFEHRTLDHVTGTWSTATMTQEDVDAWQAGRERSGTFGIHEQAARLKGPSRLTRDERELLEEVYRNDSWHNNDNKVRARAGELIALMPKLNATEVAKYVPCFIDYLLDGKTSDEEDAIIQSLVEALSPVQRLYLHLVSRKLHGRIAHNLNAERWFDYLRSMRSAAEQICAELDLDFSAEDFDLEDAAALLTKLVGTAPKGGPTVGSPKGAYTMADMETYVKAMEDELNAVGEDAQLANVDLQNTLQRLQQVISMLSNISKIIHETSMAITKKVSS